MKKQEEYEELKKPKNWVKGLENDEIEFLQEVDNQKAEMESLKYQEEFLAIEEYKQGVAHLNSEEQDTKLFEFKRELFQKLKTKSPNKNSDNKTAPRSQAQLLSGSIKRKMTNSETNDSKTMKKTTESDAASTSKVVGSVQYRLNVPTIHCIGKLPGLGCYDDNSDSCDSDRDSDESFNESGDDTQVFANPPSKENNKK